ncbi:hypothetical protein MRX96_045077 [Rhipicephalus microplus]
MPTRRNQRGSGVVSAFWERVRDGVEIQGFGVVQLEAANACRRKPAEPEAQLEDRAKKESAKSEYGDFCSIGQVKSGTPKYRRLVDASNEVTGGSRALPHALLHCYTYEYSSESRSSRSTFLRALLAAPAARSTTSVTPVTRPPYWRKTAEPTDKVAPFCVAVVCGSFEDVAGLLARGQKEKYGTSLELYL